MLGDQLGFKRDHIISIDRVWQLRSRTGNVFRDSRKSFANEISKIPGVEEIMEAIGLIGTQLKPLLHHL
jgi:hypothetical protein